MVCFSVLYKTSRAGISQSFYSVARAVAAKKCKKVCCMCRIVVLLIGVANGTTKNVGLGKFWQDLEISEAFLISLEVSFLHGLFLLFLSLETFYQRVSGSDF